MSPQVSLPASNLLSLFRLIGQLKTTARTGWVYEGICRPESVSDHMYRMCLMVLAISPDPSRTDRLVKMTLVHDLAEAEVGDIAPADNVSKAEKHRREETAMRRIRDDILAGHELGSEFYDLWLEYDRGETEDAKFVKEIDKLEMIIQADEYEGAQEKDLSGFFKSVEGAFHSPIIIDLNVELRSERDRRRK